MQMHYLRPRPDDDESGVELHYSTEVQPRSVSVISFAQDFRIPPRSARHHVRAACCVSGFLPLQPLGFRVHAHTLGRRIWLDKAAWPRRTHESWANGAVRASRSFVTLLHCQPPSFWWLSTS